MMEEPTAPIHVVMSRVMADMKAIAKNRQNKDQKYAFRGIDDVMNELKPVLSEHGVFYVPEGIAGNEHEWRQTRSGGWQHSTILKLRYRFYGPAGDSIVAETIGESADSADKSTQQAMSQALKSLLLQTFCIGTEESARSDPDSKSPIDGGPPPTHVDLMPYVKEKMNGEQWAKLKQEWMKAYPYSVHGVPVSREQEMCQLIDTFANADSDTGEVKSPEPNAQERSDEGAEAQQQPATNEIDLPRYEHPLKPEKAKEILTEIFDPYVEAYETDKGKRITKLQVKRREANDIWTEAGYEGMEEIGAVEWGILMSFVSERIQELKAAA